MCPCHKILTPTHPPTVRSTHPLGGGSFNFLEKGAEVNNGAGCRGGSANTQTNVVPRGNDADTDIDNSNDPEWYLRLERNGLTPVAVADDGEEEKKKGGPPKN